MNFVFSLGMVKIMNKLYREFVVNKLLNLNKDYSANASELIFNLM